LYFAVVYVKKILNPAAPRRLRLFARAMIAVCILMGLAAPPVRGEETRYSFIPHWLPQAQFAGYYMAAEKGFYRDRGINLVVMRGGPEYPPAATIARKKVTFATTFLSSAIQLRSQGVRLVNIGQIVQRSGFILVTRKAAAINTPADLNGKKVGLWSDFRLQPLAFFRKYGVDVKPVYQGATMNLFLRGGVAAASAMWYNEYHTLLNSGLNEDELNPFFFDRYGLNFPEDGLYCLEETFRRDPDHCRAFVRASLEGWEYAFAHMEETLDVVMRYIQEANVGTNRIHQKWMLARMKDLIIPPGSNVPLGRLDREDYLRVAGEMKISGLVKEIPPYGEMYADCTGLR
jgi:NitT/TauT family transport system substrate-binding protein